MTLADKIVVLRDGIIEQVGTPLQLYDDPDNLFVAGFIGSPKMNFLRGVLAEGGVRLPDHGDVVVPTQVNAAPGTGHRRAAPGALRKGRAGGTPAQGGTGRAPRRRDLRLCPARAERPDDARHEQRPRSRGGRCVRGPVRSGMPARLLGRRPEAARGPLAARRSCRLLCRAQAIEAKLRARAPKVAWQLQAVPICRCTVVGEAGSMPSGNDLATPASSAAQPLTVAVDLFPLIPGVSGGIVPWIEGVLREMVRLYPGDRVMLFHRPGACPIDVDGDRVRCRAARRAPGGLLRADDAPLRAGGRSGGHPQLSAGAAPGHRLRAADIHHPRHPARPSAGELRAVGAGRPSPGICLRPVLRWRGGDHDRALALDGDRPSLDDDGRRLPDAGGTDRGVARPSGRRSSCRARWPGSTATSISPPTSGRTRTTGGCSRRCGLPCPICRRAPAWCSPEMRRDWRRCWTGSRTCPSCISAT
jgi:hypothetical protein